MEYIYLCDRLGKAMKSIYVGRKCKAVRRSDGKCIRGRNSNMLVDFENGDRVTVLARMLRKIK